MHYTPNTVSFPSLQAIGWIPFIKDFKNNTYGNYTPYASTKKRFIACDQLFLSGNDPEPPGDKELQNETDFDNFLSAAKNYRAAIALRDVKLEIFPDGKLKAYATPLDKGKCIGYTPVRNSVSRTHKVMHYSKGYGGHGSDWHVDPIYYSHKARLPYVLYFRIGFIGNLIARLLTGHYAPKAKMIVEYTLYTDGTYKAEVRGSHIPSQS